MGTADLAERELLQGLIKLAAAFVHDARSNPAGIRKNLAGALDRVRAGRAARAAVGVDADALAAAIEERLAGELSVGEAPIRVTRTGRGD